MPKTGFWSRLFGSHSSRAPEKPAAPTEEKSTTPLPGSGSQAITSQTGSHVPPTGLPLSKAAVHRETTATPSRTISVEERKSLYAAIKQRDVNSVHSLINSGVSSPPDSLQHLGWYFVTDDNSLEIVELLIASGADVNHPRQIDGWTPVMSAAYGRCPRIVNLLIQSGADTAIREERGRTVFQLVQSEGSWADDRYNNTLSILVQATKDGQQWSQTDKGKEWKRNLLVDTSAPIPATPAKVTAILRKAIRGEDENFGRIKEWVESGGDLGWRTPNGWTLLHLAAQVGSPKMVEFLLSHGADVEARDNRNETPLILACDNGYAEHKPSPSVITLLLDRSADPNAVDCDGRTALNHLGQVRSDVGKEIVKLLEGVGSRNPINAFTADFQQATREAAPAEWAAQMWFYGRTEVNFYHPRDWVFVKREKSMGLFPPDAREMLPGRFSPEFAVLYADAGLEGQALIDAAFQGMHHNYNRMEVISKSSFQNAGWLVLVLAFTFLRDREKLTNLCAIYVKDSTLVHFECVGYESDIISRYSDIKRVLGSARLIA
jgi:uncharacterized protein